MLKMSEIPEPKTSFIMIECFNCSNNQIVFTHSTLVVKCNSCKEDLTKPTGGKAIIKGSLSTKTLPTNKKY